MLYYVRLITIGRITVRSLYGQLSFINKLSHEYKSESSWLSASQQFANSFITEAADRVTRAIGLRTKERTVPIASIKAPIARSSAEEHSENPILYRTTGASGTHSTNGVVISPRAIKPIPRATDATAPAANNIVIVPNNKGPVIGLTKVEKKSDSLWKGVKKPGLPLYA